MKTYFYRLKEGAVPGAEDYLDRKLVFQTQKVFDLRSKIVLLVDPHKVVEQYVNRKINKLETIVPGQVHFLDGDPKTYFRVQGWQLIPVETWATAEDLVGCPGLLAVELFTEPLPLLTT